MSPTLFLLIVLVLAWLYDFLNGMNDCANAIATTVSTRALSPRQAVLLAAVLNLVGAFITTEVAKTVGKGIVDPNVINEYVIISALIGTNIWAALATRAGIPISITHSLVGGIMGAAVFAKGFGVLNMKVIYKILIAMVVSPILGFIVGFTFLAGVFWAFRKALPNKANSILRNAQLLSASFMALSHGANDTQNAMGIITAALVTTGFINEFKVPVWVIFGSAFFMALGTQVGGWRVIKTMGVKMVKLRPAHGFSAETSSAAVILGATLLGIPISTTHVISTAIMGVGASEKLSGVRWGVAMDIVLTWIFTIPGAALFAGITYEIFKIFI